MNSLENPRIEVGPEFDVGEFDLGADFDINAAFQEALHGVAADEELELDEKVRRMEVIVNEGSSELYKEFVDFRQMAAQMQMFCNHDHSLNLAIEGNETLTGFIDNHNHSKDEEVDPITGKKRKKKRK